LVDKPSPEPFSDNHSLPSLSNTHPNTAERVDKILEDEIVPTKSGGTCKYLIGWKGKASTEDIWLD